MSGPLLQEASSTLHRAPAWLKLGLGFLLGITLASLSHPLVPALSTLIWLILQALAKQNPWKTMRSCWPALPLVGAIGLTHGLGGHWLSGLLLLWRLCLLLWIAHLVAACTSSGEFLKLLERILRPFPLRWLGISSRDVGIMLLISIRFLPLMQEEIKSLLKAQRARAFSPRRLSWKERFKHLLLMGQLLLEGVFRRAEQVSRALRARAYLPGSLNGSSGSEAM
ncbi:MAG: energy-coupling factor transporter transmembrane component T [bacterium]